MKTIAVRKHYLYDIDITLRSVRLFSGFVSYQITTERSGIIFQGHEWLAMMEFDLLVNGPIEPMPLDSEIEGCV